MIDSAPEHYQTNPLALFDLIVRSQAAYDPPGETTRYLRNRMPSTGFQAFPITKISRPLNRGSAQNASLELPSVCPFTKAVRTYSEPSAARAAGARRAASRVRRGGVRAIEYRERDGFVTCGTREDLA